MCAQIILLFIDVLSHYMYHIYYVYYSTNTTQDTKYNSYDSSLIIITDIYHASINAERLHDAC